MEQRYYNLESIPQPLYTGTWGNCHIQGICVDWKKGHIYYSFTTKLVKATLGGKIIGTVDGLVGHLGCIAFNEEDGCVYGSLEYKNDAIGKGILTQLKSDIHMENAFFVVRFDVDRIERMDINADGNDIMTGVYLNEVISDYSGFGKNVNGDIVPHRYGCSGIDGITFGPLPGKQPAEGMYLYVAYGIYGDPDRQDNDYQILLCYNTSEWQKYARPLNQKAIHTFGFEHPLHKYFVYTGNTRYGVQNLEYDPHTNAFFLAVYKGKKAHFPNYDLFVVDANIPSKVEFLRGIGETGEVLTLSQAGEHDKGSGIRGWYFPYGATGLCSFGDGRWLICDARKSTSGQCGYIFQYIWDGKTPFVTIASYEG